MPQFPISFRSLLPSRIPCAAFSTAKPRPARASSITRDFSSRIHPAKPTARAKASSSTKRTHRRTRSMCPQASSKWSDDPMKDGSQSSDDPRTERAMIHIRLPVRQGDTAHLLTLPIPFSRLVQQGLTAHTQHPADGLKPRLKDPQLGTPSSQCGEQRDW